MLRHAFAQTPWQARAGLGSAKHWRFAARPAFRPGFACHATSAQKEGNAVMAELLPAGVEIAIPVAGALLYACIWFATRNLSRAAKILGRVAPLGLIAPVTLYLSGLHGSGRPDITSMPAPAPNVQSQAPPTPTAGDAQRQ
jgi:hypothetical protein